MINLPSIATESSLEMLAFSIWLRTGRRVPVAQLAAEMQAKFNPWHDPANGQFTNSMFAGSESVGAQTSHHVSRPSHAPIKKVGEHGHAAKPKQPNLPSGWQVGGEMNPSKVDVRANHAIAQYFDNKARGMSDVESAAWAANSEIESRGNPASIQESSGPGRGYFQWGTSTDPTKDRRKDFEKAFGVSIEKSTLEQQLQFRDYELAHKEAAAKKRIDAAVSAGDKAFAIAVHYLRPANSRIRGIERANLARAILLRGQMLDQMLKDVRHSFPIIPSVPRPAG